MTAHPHQADPEPQDARPVVPEALAQQVALIRRQLEPTPTRPGADLIRYVDAGLLNICELAEVGMNLLNRVMALRTAAEQLGQAVDRSDWRPDPERDDLLKRALDELSALEEVLVSVGPSPATVALGVRW